MSKTKEFIENYKLQKALGDFRCSLANGDKLHMFNCLYKVVSSTGEQTILEDEKTSRFAIPTAKLALLMKKGFAKNHGVISLAKAQISGPSAKVGVSSKALAGAGAGSGKPGPRGEPVGTTKQGSDGEWYKKTSDNPSKWVHIGKGTSHATPGSPEHGPLSNPQDQEKFLNLRAQIKSLTKPEAHDHLEKLATEWITQQAKFKNLQAAHNTNDVDQKGRKLPRTGIANSTLNQIYAEQDKALALHDKLRDAIIAAKRTK